MKVLIVTRSDDVDTVDAVSRELRARGAEVRRLDTDRFPTDERVRIAVSAEEAEVELGPEGDAWRLSEVDAVWYRRFDAGGGLPAELDPALRHAAIVESRAALFGVLEGLEVFCLDPLAAVRRAESKELQLRLARKLGLDVPRTLVTNDPEAARRFARSCPGGVVAKMLQPPPAGPVEAGGVGGAVFTRPLGEVELARLDDLRLCPMVFQERLAKRRELRVTLVGERVFAAELDSAAIPGAEEDWRRVPEQTMGAWRATELDGDVIGRLRALRDALGLRYGAADLVHTEDDRLVFLELNPGGQYRWLEVHAGLPISAAIAEVLTTRGARVRPAAAAREAR